MPPVKPSWRTGEFWLHLGYGAAIVVLTGLISIQEQLPPLAKAVVGAVGLAALAWLQQQYAKGRVDLKKAALEAGAAAAAGVDTPAKAIDALNKP